jgi:DNA-directed RNA polymerase subunit RPC12/RpoP
MAPRGNKRRTGPSDTTDWESERTLAEAEEGDAIESDDDLSGRSCPCGSREFVLEAFLHVVEGRIRHEPIDVEALTCPHCGREFEAIESEGGEILRGEFRGQVELEDEDD